MTTSTPAEELQIGFIKIDAQRLARVRASFEAQGIETSDLDDEKFYRLLSGIAAVAQLHGLDPLNMTDYTRAARIYRQMARG